MTFFEDGFKAIGDMCVGGTFLPWDPKPQRENTEDHRAKEQLDFLSFVLFPPRETQSSYSFTFIIRADFSVSSTNEKTTPLCLYIISY